MIATWKAALIVAALGLMLPGLGAQCKATKPGGSAASTSTKSDVPSDNQHEIEIRDVLIALEQAINSKNAAQAGTLFADDGLFIDHAGDETRGRAAIEDRFAQRFKNEAIQILGLHPEKLSFPASKVCLVVGVVSRKQGQEDLPATRFSMLLVKQGSRWLINEVTETVMQKAQNESHLRDLSWLIGDWQVDKPNASARMNVEWAPGNKFILSKCTLTKTGDDPQIDTQVIGWDPQNNNMVSWHFDSSGGFGSGTWTKEPGKNQWTVNVVGVGADGSNTRASNVFTQKSADSFAWQSVHRSLDGAPVNDTDVLDVQRVKR